MLRTQHVGLKAWLEGKYSPAMYYLYAACHSCIGWKGVLMHYMSANRSGRGFSNMQPNCLLQPVSRTQVLPALVPDFRSLNIAKADLNSCTQIQSRRHSYFRAQRCKPTHSTIKPDHFEVELQLQAGPCPSKLWLELQLLAGPVRGYNDRNCCQTRSNAARRK